MRKLLIIFALAGILTAQDKSDIASQNEKMKWFADAKLGIFIHWGIYAVKGIDESWSFFNGKISHEDYLTQTAGFSAENYNPEYWAKLIKQSGARYSVITSKHHDGFALWNTKFGELNAVKNSAAGRDLLTPFVQAIRKNNLKVGLYFSLIDWSHENYTQLTREKARYKIKDDPERWQKFTEYFQGQLNELLEQYNPDLWWFDGGWEHNAEEWEAEKVRNMLLAKNPNAILNSRLPESGDYGTPEQGPPMKRPDSKYWELCMTMNDSWGYQHNDHNYKTPQQIIDIFVDCVSMGGNLLLDIGPKADGTIPREQENILTELGEFNSMNGSAIFGTHAGIPKDYFYGPTTLSPDSTVIYLFVKGNENSSVALKGIKNNVKRVRVVGDGTKLSFKTISKIDWAHYPGIIYIDLPEFVLQKYYTALAVQLDGKISLL